MRSTEILRNEHHPLRRGRAYVDLLGGHIQKENQVLFRMADRVLDAASDDHVTALYARYDADELGPGERERLLAGVSALADTYL